MRAAFKVKTHDGWVTVYQDEHHGQQTRWLNICAKCKRSFNAATKQDRVCPDCLGEKSEGDKSALAAAASSVPECTVGVRRYNEDTISLKCGHTLIRRAGRNGHKDPVMLKYQCLLCASAVLANRRQNQPAVSLNQAREQARQMMSAPNSVLGNDATETECRPTTNEI